MANKIEPNQPRDLMRRLVDIANHDYRMHGPTRHPHTRYGKPGELYLAVTGPISRQIMKGLKPEDNADDRWYDNFNSSNRKK